ncbi:class I SAM-dependent methyltransferase [Nocardia yunnanensis]|uniref:Class I SAM-dependent methyltransferase n=1 Tax=Nocardia yunnanensis TaxID=2382165 RepID=A0A386Z9G5_9NOCA|nr:class I SAM-dependent methyltransferase [Nocardia yunnanensis]AYF74196.1 class I SAM-dependent methyltransferase [Nocardia yunnanensis]
MSWSSETPLPGTPHYTLPNDWDFAAERLALLGAAYDPGSIALAQRLGVSAGWRCLEAGAGGGSFARWLCGTALPGGRVLAVDADTRHLTDLPALGGEVAQLDLVTDEIPAHAFDFVHTRFVLLHIADRDIVLRRLARALAPGGILLLEEGDGLGVPAEMPGPFGEVWRAFAHSTELAGANQSWARTLPTHLNSLGLTDIQAEAEIPLFRGASPTARVWNLTWTQSRNALIPLGIPPTLITAAQADLEDDQQWFHAPPTIRVWARKADLTDL